MTEDMVTVKCWKCHGSGRYARGACYGCDGSGVNTYSAAAYARRQANAAGRAAAERDRNTAARSALDERLAAMSLDELADWVRDVACIGPDGLLDDWRPGSETETERITVEEKARRLRAEYSAG